MVRDSSEAGKMHIAAGVFFFVCGGERDGALNARKTKYFPLTGLNLMGSDGFDGFDTRSH